MGAAQARKLFEKSLIKNFHFHPHSSGMEMKVSDEVVAKRYRYSTSIYLYRKLLGEEGLGGVDRSPLPSLNKLVFYRKTIGLLQGAS